jgi:integrase
VSRRLAGPRGGGVARDFIRYAAAVVRSLSDRTPAGEFGTKKLKAVQRAMAERGWCRSTGNAQVDRVRRVFKWAVAEDLVGGVYHALRAVEGLRRGSPGVRDPQPVRSVAAEAVEATLPHLTPTMRAIVRVQMLTGMWPGEVCDLTAELEMWDGGVWLFRPSEHKTRHHGRERVVLNGPQAQDILRPFIARGGPFLVRPRLAELDRKRGPASGSEVADDPEPVRAEAEAEPRATGAGQV